LCSKQSKRTWINYKIRSNSYGRGLDKIYDKICRYDTLQRNNCLSSLYSHIHEDRLGMLSVLSDKFVDFSEPNQFLVRKFFGEELKNTVGILIPIVTIVVTIVGLKIEVR
jgi:hypothetical protein